MGTLFEHAEVNINCFRTYFKEQNTNYGPLRMVQQLMYVSFKKHIDENPSLDSWTLPLMNMGGNIMLFRGAMGPCECTLGNIYSFCEIAIHRYWMWYTKVHQSGPIGKSQSTAINRLYNQMVGKKHAHEVFGIPHLPRLKKAMTMHIDNNINDYRKGICSVLADLQKYAAQIDIDTQHYKHLINPQPITKKLNTTHNTITVTPPSESTVDADEPAPKRRKLDDFEAMLTFAAAQQKSAQNEVHCAQQTLLRAQANLISTNEFHNNLMSKYANKGSKEHDDNA